MKRTIIYRVVAKTGPFVSVWVASKKEAEKIMKKVSQDIIFGNDTYYIEKAEIAL